MGINKKIHLGWEYSEKAPVFWRIYHRRFVSEAEVLTPSTFRGCWRKFLPNCGFSHLPPHKSVNCLDSLNMSRTIKVIYGRWGKLIVLVIIAFV